ncbi:MAG TPA: tetratricopeptide repeat protein [Thiotrichales bacterium]|nr:tetratricopeptide repeat protein [Thiotrichales bacterium]
MRAATRLPAVGLLPLLVAGCSLLPTGREDGEPTLAELPEIPFSAAPPADAMPASRERAIESYEAFLQEAESHPMRAEALKRLADLRLDQAEHPGGDDAPPPSPEQAITEAVSLYARLLRDHPDYDAADTVLYQMARASEQQGELELALAWLDRLVERFPDSPLVEEAQFRRGEINFSFGRFRQAEAAYQAVLEIGSDSEFRQRSLLKLGWSRFKLGLYPEALVTFSRVLDLELRLPNGSIVAERPDAGRAEIELIEDTLRVMTLAASYLDGHPALGRLMEEIGERPWGWRLYRRLGDLYLEQERFTDAAETFHAFVVAYPLKIEAPRFQAAVIDAYGRGGFPTLQLAAKAELVERFGAATPFRKANATLWLTRAAPLVKRNIRELAAYHHALAQKSHRKADFSDAVHWYRLYLASFPAADDAPHMNFLLAEALMEAGDRFAAAQEYEKSAYDYPRHSRSAEAGYAALLAWEKAIADRPERRREIDLLFVYSTARFAEAFPRHPQVPTALGRAAEKLFGAGDHLGTIAIAERLVALRPPPAPDLQRTAWTLLAHSRNRLGRYGPAEAAYLQALRLTPRSDPDHAPLREQLAAVVYRQAEQLLAADKPAEAANRFLEAARTAPDPKIAAAAHYDAAAALIQAKAWQRAIDTLLEFRRRWPKSPLQAEVTTKLAVAYLEAGEPASAASEFAAIAVAAKDPALRREADWQAATLYEQAGRHRQAVDAWKVYVKRHPRPLPQAMEARVHLVRLYERLGESAKARYWRRQMVKADASGGSGRTDRTRLLAGQAQLALADEALREYRRIRLTIPLERSLKRKKRAMKAALGAYRKAASYRLEGVTTAATYRIGEIYNHFAKALMTSQRPKDLNAEELEEYELLLEDQAWPFEEKAIEIHAANARRSVDGIYDEWVRKSFERLAELQPVRYAKRERVEKVYEATP